MTYSHRILPIAGGQQPSFKIVPVPTLPSDSITINGTTKTPDFQFLGSAATANSWTSTYGGMVAAKGGTPTVGNYGILESCTEVSTASNASYSVASTWNIGTKDIVYEALVKTPDSQAADCVLNYIMNGDIEGCGVVLYNSTKKFGFSLSPTFASNVITYSDAVSLGTYYHFMAFCDRSGSCQIYINGVASGSSVNVSGSAGAIELDPIPYFSIGYWREAGGYFWNSNIALLQAWTGAAWLDTHLQAAVAVERFSRVCGIYPNKAGTYAPTTATRSTSASLERYVSSGVKKIFTVGPNWIRTVQKTDTADQVVTGILIESQKKNEFTYSQDFNNAAWTKTRCSVSNNGATAPDGTATADGLIGDANDNTHMFEQALTPDSGDQVFSVFLKAGALSWARLDILQDANCYQYFDLATSALGASGTSVNLLDKGIENFGSGWRRCWIRYSGISGAHDHHIHACPANNDQTYAGDGATVDLWVWGAQHEPDSGAATSYTYTAAAAVTKTADSLKYSTTSNIAVGEGALETSTVIEDQDTPTQKTIVAISNAGSATQKFQIDVDTSNKSHCSSIVSTVVASIVGTQNWCNGLKRKLMSQWEANDIRLYNDGVEVSSRDTSCTVAASMTVIDVGQDSAGANQLDGIIADIKFYRKPLKG